MRNFDCDNFTEMCRKTCVFRSILFESEVEIGLSMDSLIMFLKF